MKFKYKGKQFASRKDVGLVLLKKYKKLKKFKDVKEFHLLQVVAKEVGMKSPMGLYYYSNDDRKKARKAFLKTWLKPKKKAKIKKTKKVKVVKAEKKTIKKTIAKRSYTRKTKIVAPKINIPETINPGVPESLNTPLLDVPETKPDETTPSMECNVAVPPTIDPVA